MRTKAPRTSRINKQKMYYSLYSGTVPVYETDENGMIVYTEVDGEMYPVEAGTQEARYTMPVEFEANINSELNEMHLRAWGVDQSSIYAEIVCQKDYLPIGIGTIIWRKSPITYDDLPDSFMETDEGAFLAVDDTGETYLVSNTGERVPHQASSDYTVVGIRDEGLWEDWYLLRRNSSDSSEPGN